MEGALEIEEATNCGGRKLDQLVSLEVASSLSGVLGQSELSHGGWYGPVSGRMLDQLVGLLLT
jgi:hypothetical protein